MKKNKILTVIICVICLVSVLSIHTFASFGGVTNGDSLYSESTFIKPDYLFLNDVTIGAISNKHDINLPFDGLYGLNAPLISIPVSNPTSNHLVYASIDNYSDENEWFSRIDFSSADDFTFNSCGLKFKDSSISFKEKSYLIDYLQSSTDAFPCVISGSDSHLSHFTLSCTATIYNGNVPGESESFVVTSSVLSSSYTRLVKPFLDHLCDWVNSLDITGWNSLVITDLKIRSAIKPINASDLDYLQVSCYYPVQDGLNDFLSFNSVSDTTIVEVEKEIIKYDLNPLQFIFDTVNKFFAIELFPNPISPGNSVTFGGITAIILGLFGLSFILKALAGK